MRPLSSTLFPYTTLFRSLYELIEKSLVNDYGLGIFRRGRDLRKAFSVHDPLSQEEINSIPSWLNFRIPQGYQVDRKSTRLNSSHVKISYAVFCLKKKIIR